MDKFILPKNKTYEERTKKIQVYTPEELLKEVDVICKKAGYSRNKLIIEMIKFSIKNMEIGE